MRFKTGDKVKFLNEKGGGTVIAVIDSKVVKVETDDGFEMPVLSKDLIPDYRSEPDYENTTPSNIGTQQHQDTGVPVEESNVTDLNPWVKIKEEKGIYMVYEPHDQQWVLTGDMDVILVNHTEHEIIYSLFLEQNGVLKGIDYNTVPPESKIVIDTIEREDIDNYVHGFIQILIHDDEPEKIFYPLHSVIDIRPARFYKEGSYKQNSLINKKAVLSVIALENTFETASFSETERKTGKREKTRESYIKREKPFIEKHRTAPGEAIVDLHIGEIVDNIAGLNSHDMLMLQMNYFRKALESAIAEEYRKVTFIHGVGNGVLKNNIIKELEIYSNTEHHMASISKFGVGAIDVVIKSKD
jgi:hypothetical protein